MFRHFIIPQCPSVVYESVTYIASSKNTIVKASPLSTSYFSFKIKKGRFLNVTALNRVIDQ